MRVAQRLTSISCTRMRALRSLSSMVGSGRVVSREGRSVGFNGRWTTNQSL